MFLILVAMAVYWWRLLRRERLRKEVQRANAVGG